MAAALLWAAVEVARDREAQAMLNLSIAALENCAAWAAALDAHGRALANLRRAEAEYWRHPGAGVRTVAMLAA